MEKISDIQKDAIHLLKELIVTPSFSKEEHNTATVIEQFFKNRGITARRHLNNVWVYNKHFDTRKPTLLLNSHHDTVKPNKGYTKDPFAAEETQGKLYGLGSNDAGGALVSLIATFLYFYEHSALHYNLILAATAEEEISGRNGIESILPMLGAIDCAIVGEPTLMQLAIAERGLMVLDCIASGVAGHAARSEGENAIYKAMMDIEWIYVHQFERVSELLGAVKMTVTSIESENKQHNVVPALCTYVVDVRVNELYRLEEVLKVIQSHTQSSVTARSLRLQATSIPPDHPLVKAGVSLGLKTYGSPTTSDKALMPFPALKMGPGDSARSHTSDEFIFIDEIKEGIQLSIELLNLVLK